MAEAFHDPLSHRPQIESLESLGHQGVSEPLVDGQHACVSEDPLLVGVGQAVAGEGRPWSRMSWYWGALSSGPWDG